MLEGYLRIGSIISNRCDGEKDWIVSVLQRMINAMVALEHDFDCTPLFNDSGNNISKDIKCLQNAASRLFNIYPHIDSYNLPYAGYYSYNKEKFRLLIDAGKIGPDYNPGHGHCDCLSFEMSLNGKNIFVNSGTYQYQDKMRALFRSTAYHNTIVMDKCEQSQCWGEHRVAKRHRLLFVKYNERFFEGSYMNYAGMIHTRRFSVSDEGLLVLDHIQKASEAKSYLHISPNYSIDDALVVRDERGNKCCIIKPINCNYVVEDSVYARDFGLIEANKAIVFYWKKSDSDHGYQISLV